MNTANYAICLTTSQISLILLWFKPSLDAFMKFITSVFHGHSSLDVIYKITAPFEKLEQITSLSCPLFPLQTLLLYFVSWMAKSKRSWATIRLKVFRQNEILGPVLHGVRCMDFESHCNTSLFSKRRSLRFEAFPWFSGYFTIAHCFWLHRPSGFRMIAKRYDKPVVVE